MESNGGIKVFILTLSKIGRNLLPVLYLKFINLVELSWDHQEVDSMESKFCSRSWIRVSVKSTSSVETEPIEVFLNFLNLLVKHNFQLRSQEFQKQLITISQLWTLHLDLPLPVKLLLK